MFRPALRSLSLPLLLMTLLSAAPVMASIAVQCSWPPAEGTAVQPDSTDIMMTPAVGDLDADGIPEIVVVTFIDSLDINTGEDGVLRILSGEDCSEIASTDIIPPTPCAGSVGVVDLEERGDEGVLCPGCGVAIGDLDDDGLMEIVAVSEGTEMPPVNGLIAFDRRIVVYDHAGQFLWCSERAPGHVGFVGAPSIADLDGDGTPEIIAGATAWDSEGNLLWHDAADGRSLSAVADVDGDGSPDVVMGDRAYRSDGTLMWEREDLAWGYGAIADFDLDCLPEVVFVERDSATIHLLEGATGVERSTIVLPGGNEQCAPRPGQGGPPTLADVTGDCIPEIGVAGCLQYSLTEWDANTASLVQLWATETQDISSRITGSTIFDLEGDGTFEVLYNDEVNFRIMDAADGDTIFTMGSSNGTLVEYPTLADCDADGHAEVIFVSNDYSRCCDVGLRVLHDPDDEWVSTRTLMNQHAYSITNIEDDGSIPAVAPASWQSYNNFRAQLVPTACVQEEPPTLTGVPGDVSVDCAAIPEPAEPEATDDCDENPVVSLEETEIAGTCMHSFTLVRTWTATDAHGNSVTAQQVVTVEDTQPPALVGVPEDVTVECVAPDPPEVTAEDDCHDSPTVVSLSTTTPGSCPDELTILRTWMTADLCGNMSTAAQVVEVVDQTPPDVVAQLVPLQPLPAGEPCSAPVAAQFALTCSAEDACDPDPEITAVLVVTVEERVGTECETRTESAPIECGQPFEVRLVASPCDPAAPGVPSSSAPAIVVGDDGTLIATGQSVTAEVTATDRCGNAQPVVLDVDPCEQTMVGPPPRPPSDGRRAATRERAVRRERR